MGFFDKIKQGLQKTKDAMMKQVETVIHSFTKVDDEFLEELEETLGREFRDKDDMLAGCREILDRGAKIVLLSLGKDGAVITNGTKNYYCKSINVAVNSTVGAGDGMVAAAAVMLQKGADLPDILRAGVAAGTATVTTFETISFTKNKYEEIFQSLNVTEF